MFQNTTFLTLSKQKYVQWIIFGVLVFLSIFFVWIFLPIFRDTQGWVNRIYIVDRNGILMTDKTSKEGYSIKKNIPNDYPSVPLIRELIDIEDWRFEYHFWIDILAKMRALIDNLSGNPVSGWSTLTEQYIKIKYFQDYPRSFSQKIREATISFIFSIFYFFMYFVRYYLFVYTFF